MTICSTCGNEYKKCFVVTMNNDQYYFDCFECAISKLAPICQNCGCKIIGHGMEASNSYFCCASCVRNSEANANAKITSKPSENF